MTKRKDKKLTKFITDSLLKEKEKVHNCFNCGHKRKCKLSYANQWLCPECMEIFINLPHRKA